jgi:hypothetical protein
MSGIFFIYLYISALRNDEKMFTKIYLRVISFLWKVLKMFLYHVVQRMHRYTNSGPFPLLHSDIIQHAPPLHRKHDPQTSLAVTLSYFVSVFRLI